MMNKFLAKLVTPLVIGFFLIGCNFITSGLGGNSPPEEKAPDRSQPPASNSGQNPVSGTGGNYYQLPLSPGVPPADVIQQITVAGGGGSGIICSSNCIVYEYNYEQNDEQNTISLTHFQPNQQLRIDIYYLTYTEQDGSSSDYEFLTELAVQTDSNGALEIYVDGDFPYLPLIVLDENGNVIAKPETIMQ